MRYTKFHINVHFNTNRLGQSMRYTRFNIYLYYLELNKVGQLVHEVVDPQNKVCDEVHKISSKCVFLYN